MLQFTTILDTKYADFETIPNKRMIGNAITVAGNVKNPWMCGLLCRRRHGFIQFNFHRITNACELCEHKVSLGASVYDVADGVALEDNSEWDSYIRYL